MLSNGTAKSTMRGTADRTESESKPKTGFCNILGHSRPLQQAIALARKVCCTDTSVLLLGETGTGKEVFAQAIHDESLRRGQSFVALNCSAFPKDLLENELFGHAEGAYTGATKPKKGYLEEAHEGTLFLDEVGDMNIEAQAKLLRVLETGEFYRIGESKSRHVNVRIIAATNRSLEAESDSGRFRADLFYRLSVFTISLPSLRERKEDIPLLVNHFVKHFALKCNKSTPRVSDEFLNALQNHFWKGNTRELKNVIERSVILSDKELEVSLLPADFNVTEQGNMHSLAEVEKRHIKKTLLYVNGNKTQAAKLLGIGLTTLYQKIKDYGIN
jgi:two-component system, NtrC family, response regulator